MFPHWPERRHHTIAGTPVSAVTMTITRSGNNLVISWTPAAGKLYSSPSLVNPVWTLGSSSNPATLPATGTAKFFRVWP